MLISVEIGHQRSVALLSVRSQYLMAMVAVLTQHYLGRYLSSTYIKIQVYKIHTAINAWSKNILVK